MPKAQPVKNKNKKEDTSTSPWQYVLILVFGLSLAAFIFIFGLKMYKIPSASMENTLVKGDYVAAFPLLNHVGSEDINRGDIVVFNIPSAWVPTELNELYVKRVIGLPGDRVSSDGLGGPIIINGVPVDESIYLKPNVSPSEVAFDYTVPAGTLFMMGDNRSNSQDSRFHLEDPVPIGAVINKVVMRFWPANKAVLYPSVEYVFENVPDAPQ